MNINNSQLVVAGIHVEISRKNIKNMHLSVHPPVGKVKLSVPQRMKDDNARLAIIRRLKWIKQKQQEFQQQERQSQRQYVSGESHYFDGQRYVLEVCESHQRAKVKILGNGRLQLTVRPSASLQARAQAFDEFYRQHLKSHLENCLEGWTKKVGKEPTEITIRRMKTRWGSCNQENRRILLNLELAKKPRMCVEYILVHELVHLHERQHNERFMALLTKAMPNWHVQRELLKSLPLAYETWEY